MRERKRKKEDENKYNEILIEEYDLHLVCFFGMIKVHGFSNQIPSILNEKQRERD